MAEPCRPSNLNNVNAQVLSIDGDSDLPKQDCTSPSPTETVESISDSLPGFYLINLYLKFVKNQNSIVGLDDYEDIDQDETWEDCLDEEYNDESNNIFVIDDDENSSEEIVCPSGSKSIAHKLNVHKHCSEANDRHYVSALSKL